MTKIAARISLVVVATFVAAGPVSAFTDPPKRVTPREAKGRETAERSGAREERSKPEERTSERESERRSERDTNEAGREGRVRTEYVDNNPKSTPAEKAFGREMNDRAQSGELRDVVKVEGQAESPKEGRRGDYLLTHRDGRVTQGDLIEANTDKTGNLASRAIGKNSQVGNGGTVFIEFGGKDSNRASSRLTAKDAEAVLDSIEQQPHDLGRVVIVKDGVIIGDRSYPPRK